MYDSTVDSVVAWAERDRDLEGKLRRLYKEHLSGWVAAQGSRKFEQKWHVGREMLDWFYKKKLLDADEFEALQVKHSRPSKAGYDIEMYRIVWISSGRASEEVAGLSLAPRMGPAKGYVRGPSRELGGGDADSDDSPPPPPRVFAAGPQLTLKAEQEFVYGAGGWVYCYGYEEALRYSEKLGESPLLKIGHTSGEYQDRIRSQVRGTEIPDAPKVLRAYRVVDSGNVERLVHRVLKSRGLHHRRAGGAEWFRVCVDVLDEVVKDVVAPEPGCSA